MANTQQQIKLTDDEPCISQIEERSIQPIGVLNISDRCVWLSFKKNQFCQPDIKEISYEEAKITYPSLVCCDSYLQVAERLLYQKLEYVPLTNSTENQEQGCIYDINEQLCLIKWLPSGKFSWIGIQKTDPLLIIEYFESRQVFSVNN